MEPCPAPAQALLRPPKALPTLAMALLVGAAIGLILWMGTMHGSLTKQIVGAGLVGFWIVVTLWGLMSVGWRLLVRLRGWGSSSSFRRR